jgi:hypothetical protein
MTDYTKIETAMAIICDLCQDSYLDDFCPEKDNSGKCGRRKYLEEDATDVAPVVRGHFVHDGPRFVDGVDWRHCSICGGQLPVHEKRYNETRFGYCPFCGARMDEPAPSTESEDNHE